MKSLFFFSMSMFYLGILGIMIKRLHFLSILLCLELLLISLFIMMIILSLSLSKKTILYSKLILLTLSACEASTGLSLMVALSRTHSSDLVYKIKLLQQ